MILSICEVPEILKVFKYVKIAINLIRIVAPIALILSLMITFIPVITSNDSSDLPKALKSCVNRIIATVLIFLIPTFINAIIITLDVTSINYKGCLNNATDANINAAFVKRAQIYLSSVNNSLNRSDYNIALSAINKLENQGEKDALLEQLSKVLPKIEKKEEEDREKAKIHGGGNFFQPLGDYLAQISACFDGDDEVHKGVHGATDIYAPNNTPVYAAKSGKVIIASSTAKTNVYSNIGYGCGNYVVIDHLDKTRTKYCHMYPNSITVKKGDMVTSGQKIGEVGNTGHSYGSHLHFQLLINGVAVDATDYIRFNVTNPNRCD